MGQPIVKYNPDYKPYFDTVARTCVLFGGRGSGKSVAIEQKHIAKCITYAGFSHLTIRKTLKSCRHSTFQLYLNLLAAAGIPVHVNRTEMTITFGNGSRILHAGMDDPLKLTSIVGIDSIHIEEADQLTEDDFEEADVLMRGRPTCGHFQTTLSFNPRRSKFWVRKRFVDNPTSGAFVLHTTWRNNIFVGKEYGARLAAIPDANKRAIYEAGEWGEDVKGLIYPSYTMGPLPVDEDGNVEPPTGYGLDIGFVHPMALTAQWDRDPVLHVQEVIYASGLTTPALIEEMERQEVSKELPIYVDSAYPAVILELQNAGYNAMKSDKSVLDGIASVKRFNICLSPDSVSIADELDSYKWMETKDGIIKQQPVKEGDDACDAIRYFVHTHIGMTTSWGMWGT